MMLVIPKGYENGGRRARCPTPRPSRRMMKYNESLQKAGVLLALDGLHPPSMGARVSFHGRQAQGDRRALQRGQGSARRLLDDPGEVEEEAIEWASRCPARRNEIIEVRQVQEMADFPADVQEAAAKFPELKARSGRGRGDVTPRSRRVSVHAPGLAIV